MSKRYALKRYLGWTEDDIKENETLWRQEQEEPVSGDIGGGGAAADLRTVGAGPGGEEFDFEEEDFEEGGEEMEAPEGDDIPGGEIDLEGGEI